MTLQAHRLAKPLGRVLLVAALAWAPLSACAQPATESEAQLTVSGEGAISATPDMAFISAGVTTEGKTAQDALRKNSSAMQAVIAEIKSAGVENRDIQTSQLRLSPQYRSYSRSESGPPQIIGYTAANEVQLRVRDLEDLGQLLDAVVASGATNFGGVNFALSEPEPITNQARRAAIDDAKAKAELYADAAGVRLGRILSINDGGSYAPARRMRVAALSESDAGFAPVEAGEQSITANVTLVYEIIN